MAKKKSFEAQTEAAASKFFTSSVTRSDVLNTNNIEEDKQVDVKTLNKPETDIINKNLKSNPKHRLHVILDVELLEYVQIMQRLDGDGSMVQYIKNLIMQDKITRSQDYEKAKELFNLN